MGTASADLVSGEARPGLKAAAFQICPHMTEKQF